MLVSRTHLIGALVRRALAGALAGALAVFAGSGCGGPPVVASAPSPPMMKPSTDPPPPLPSQAEVPATPAPAAEADTEPEAPPPSPQAPPPAAVERTQDPVAMITNRDAAFLVDYANSAPKAKATSACEQKAEGAPEKLGACLSKAREDFLPDVLRFRRDSEKQVSLLVYKRTGSSLRELSVGVVTLTAEPPDTVRVKFSGRQKGARPIFRGRSEFRLSVPNDYSIELDDPELGHLRYDAKIGLVAD